MVIDFIYSVFTTSKVDRLILFIDEEPCQQLTLADNDPKVRSLFSFGQPQIPASTLYTHGFPEITQDTGALC